jgi:hypothetical protein
MVEKHIKSLLYDHDCVIIPEFGGLITRYVSAKINPVKHAFAPPSKKIAFNEKLVLNDGLLISTIAFHNNITKEEALQLVTSFVHRARTCLHQQNRFELRDIGIFRYNPERKLEFEYIEGDNLLDASFGLPELTARPVRVEEPAVLRTLIKERQQEHANQKQPLRKRIKRAYNVAAGLALAGLTVSGLYILSLQTEYNMGSLNPMTLINSTYSTSTTGATNKYASDFKSVTAEDRVAIYSPIVPLSAPEEAEQAEPTAVEVKEATVVGSASAALAVASETDINQAVKAEEVVTAEVVEPAEPVLTIKDKTGRSYIIVGGYSTAANAQERQDAVRKAGHDSKVLLPGRYGKLHRVSVADFATPDEAKAAINSYKKSFGETIWVLNY